MPRASFSPQVVKANEHDIRRPPCGDDALSQGRRPNSSFRRSFGFAAHTEFAFFLVYIRKTRVTRVERTNERKSTHQKGDTQNMDCNNYFIDRGKHLWRRIKGQHKIRNIPIKFIACEIIPGLQRFIYTARPKEKTRINEVLGRAEDIQSTLGLPLYYAYKDGITIRIAVSEHETKKTMRLLKILRSPQFHSSDMEIPFAIGYDLTGNMRVVDLAKLLHLLIVGPTGSGKSVAIKCLILSIIVKCSVEAVRLIVFEIGSESLAAFNNVAHLHHDFVKDVETGVVVLESLIVEMDHRYTLGEHECQSLAYLVCIIDEFDDTIANISDKDISARFTRALDSLIRRGRKAKIILVLASHNPTLKTTGVNVNGIVARIGFQNLKHQNSSTALGIPGTEKLPGDGAMIFKTPGKVEHLQGSWVTDAEIKQILSTRPEGYDDIDMLDTTTSEIPLLSPVDYEAVNRGISVESENKELAWIVVGVLGCERISATKIRELFRVSDKRSRKVMDILDGMKLLGEKNSTQPRQVVPTCYEDLSEEVINFLKRYSYTGEQIREAFRIRTLLQQSEAYGPSSTSETELSQGLPAHKGSDSNDST